MTYKWPIEHLFLKTERGIYTVPWVWLKDWHLFANPEVHHLDRHPQSPPSHLLPLPALDWFPVDFPKRWMNQWEKNDWSAANPSNSSNSKFSSTISGSSFPRRPNMLLWRASCKAKESARNSKMPAGNWGETSVSLRCWCQLLIDNPK